jgi:hypothetical protein
MIERSEHGLERNCRDWRGECIDTRNLSHAVHFTAMEAHVIVGRYAPVLSCLR